MKICKERPILFSAPMVRAILAGRKTQTRRVLKPQLPDEAFDVSVFNAPTIPESAKAEEGLYFWDSDGIKFHSRCPYGQPGDRLWVRETWAHDGPDLETVRARAEDALEGGETYGPYYKATEVAPDTLYWRPSIHMPRWASRITLEVVDVRVERLQDISERDAREEGCFGVGVIEPPDARICTSDGELPSEEFHRLWESINAKTHPWASNPWVWVVEFRRVAPS